MGELFTHSGLPVVQEQNIEKYLSHNWQKKSGKIYHQGIRVYDTMWYLIMQTVTIVDKTEMPDGMASMESIGLTKIIYYLLHAQAKELKSKLPKINDEALTLFFNPLPNNLVSYINCVKGGGKEPLDNQVTGMHSNYKEQTALYHFSSNVIQDQDYTLHKKVSAILLYGMLEHHGLHQIGQAKR